MPKSEQKFITSVNRPFALVRAQGSGQPGRRPASRMAWLEFENPDGTFDGGEIWLKPHTGCTTGRVGGLHFNYSQWSFMYKHPKVFKPEDILYRFPHRRGHSSADKTLHLGGPLHVEITRAKKALPIIPNPVDEVERPSKEGSI